MDMLNVLFDRQIQFQKEATGAELPAERPDLVSFHALGVVTELVELLQSDKRWKRKDFGYGDTTTNEGRDAIASELADLWNFVINVTLVHGFSADDLYYATAKKQNEVRERNGLTPILIPLHSDDLYYPDGNFKGDMP